MKCGQDTARSQRGVSAMSQVRHVNDRLGDLSSLVEVNARELLTSELADPIVPVECEENHL